MANRNPGIFRLASRFLDLDPPKDPTEYARYIERIIQNDSFFRSVLRAIGPEKLFSALHRELENPHPTPDVAFLITRRLKSILAESPKLPFNRGSSHLGFEQTSVEIMSDEMHILHGRQSSTNHAIVQYVWKALSPDKDIIQIARQNMITLLFAIDHPSIVTIDTVIQSDSGNSPSCTFSAFSAEPLNSAIQTLRELRPNERPPMWIDVVRPVVAE
ncbi:hypothetical protein DL93DRAFT_1183270 [Clavulina sp. PMI_390]|nr:hypothetical protein DL93DRAFT_1183270 [Clavulina sp. PMI_390]